MSTKIRAILTFLTGEYSNETIKLRRDATIIGRDKGDIIVGDKEMSASHCQIQEIGGEYHIFDMNSTNGTYVNRQKILKAKLKEGDIISVGGTNIKVSFKEEKDATRVPTVFSLARMKESKSASLVETLIQNELRNTQSSGIKIWAEYPNGAKEELELKQRMLVIGRGSAFGQFDKDKEISRKHLLVKLSQTGEVFVQDQGSTNGSFLNGKKINGMYLVRPEDRLQIGDTYIQIAAID